MTRAVRALAALVFALPGFASAQAAGDAPVPASAASAVAPAPACPPEPVPVTPDEVAAGLRGATDGGFLWKASKGGHASWLYGTIHVARRDWIFPGPHVLAAFRASDVVALELDPTDPAIVARLQHAIAQLPGTPELPPALEARLRRQMAATCLAPAALAGLRPEMRAVTVEVMAGAPQGLLPAYGIDLMLAGLARGAAKPLRSLETPEAQAALLVSDDPGETARGVEQVLDELEAGDGPRILGRLAGDWRRGDLDDLAAYGDWCGCLQTPEQRTDFRRLVADRNPAMADHVDRWHGQGRSLFVAVGSLHMVGPQGLPALLRARGFVVERIDFSM